MFEAVTNPRYTWVWMSAPTRYGKSNLLAMAILYMATAHKLKIPIVAGTTEKAQKIMEYILSHVGDHPSFYKGLIDLETVEQVQKLKVQASKRALRWASGGWIYVTSVDSRSVSREGEGVVGEGGDIVVLEEAGLIKHKEQFSKVIRMVEGDWGKLVMSGNCIEGSVFEDAYNDPLYYKVRIELDQAIAEGRINEERLEAQKSQTTSKDWKRYYLVEFPEANEFTYFKPQRYEVLPRGLKYYAGIDLALGESKKGSRVGIVTLARDENGQVYEVESIVENLTPEETIREIFNLQHQYTRIGIESVQFQRYFIKVVEQKSKKEGRYLPIEGIRQTKDKMARIESLEPFINTGQILFKGGNVLWEEMQEFPQGDFIDGLDALEMAWRMITRDTNVGVIQTEGLEIDI